MMEKNKRETLRIALEHYRGCDLVDVRVCVELTSVAGVLTPTAKGVALSIVKLPALIEALTAAEAKARELGWISEVSR